MVTLCEHTPESAGLHGGRGPRLWAFGYRALAELLGITEGAIRQAVHDGRFDPSDLEMVCESWLRYHPYRAQTMVAQMNGVIGNPTPEEAELLEAMRARAKAERDKLPPPNAEEEVELLKQRCKTAPAPTGPKPVELLNVPQDPETRAEVRSIAVARCAEGNHVEAKCEACGFQVEDHDSDDLAACMETLRSRKAKAFTHCPSAEDPDVPF